MKNRQSCLKKGERGEWVKNRQSCLKEGEGGGGGGREEWVKNRRGRGQLYMLAIDVAQLVINKNCIKKVLLLKI